MTHSESHPENSSPQNSSASGDGRVVELKAALDHRERQIRAMQQISEALFSQATPDEVIRETLQIAIEVLSADAGSILLHNPATDMLVFRHIIGPASQSLTDFSIPASQGIAGRVFQSGIPDRTQKVSERMEFDKQVDEKTGYHTESMLTVPLKRHAGNAIGVMQILNGREQFDSRDLEVLQVMAAQASAAIENVRLMQEARKAEMINFIGDVSHDIKNMLTPVQSGVWTLQPMLDEMFEALEKIQKTCPESAPWGAQMGEALNLARGDYGWILQAALEAAENVQIRTKEIADAVKGESTSVHFAAGNLNDVAEEVARTLKPVAQKERVELKLRLDPALPDAEFDRQQLFNALYNLANNAIPETPSGGVITLCTRVNSDSTGIVIEVHDTGKGIPEHVRSRLFTDEAVSTKPGGTGLGTRIVGEIVRRHNGKITVQSEAGKGSTFLLFLPLRQKK